MLQDIGLNYAKSLLPARPPEGHKGTFGKVLCVGGSVGYTGAPYFMAEAAMRGGAGLVYLGVPETIWGVEAVKCSAAMPFPLEAREGRLSEAALPALREKIRGCSVLALGPGLGRGESTDALVRSLVSECVIPLVLDADGLNALAGNLEPLEDRVGRVTVLTPHEGEMARFAGLTLQEVRSEERGDIALAFAEAYNCILVLKGHRTLTALPDGSLYRNTSGNTALAKGGSGDILTGLIAALIGQGMQPADAAVLAVWIHGRAGELAAEAKTEFAAAPEDVLQSGIAAAFKELA